MIRFYTTLPGKCKVIDSAFLLGVERKAKLLTEPRHRRALSNILSRVILPIINGDAYAQTFGQSKQLFMKDDETLKSAYDAANELVRRNVLRRLDFSSSQGVPEKYLKYEPDTTILIPSKLYANNLRIRKEDSEQLKRIFLSNEGCGE